MTPGKTEAGSARAGADAGGVAPSSGPPGSRAGRDRRWYAHGFNRAIVYRLGALLAAPLPRSVRLAAAAALANRLAGRFPVERGVVRAALTRIVPGATAAARERLVAAVFRNFAVCFADLITTNRGSGRGLARLLDGVDGAEHPDVLGGGGAIALTAHLGNWELGGRLLAHLYARPIHVVVAAESDPGVERFLRGGPAPVNFVTNTRPTAVLPLLAALRRGDLVAMQGDRALGTRGDVPIPFFGEEAAFPLGPFVLARAAGVPLVPSFCLLTPERRYRIAVGEPIHVRADGEHAALQRWVRGLEAAVGNHPDQWFNFFDLWSVPPAR